jgi:hypothetical protein
VKVDITPVCYSWNQFTIRGQLIDDGQREFWDLPDGLFMWLYLVLKGDWGIMSAKDHTPLFIKDRREAMVFKLVWSQHLC